MRLYSNGTLPTIQLKTDTSGRFQVTQAQVSAGQGPKDLPVAQLLADGGSRGFVHFDWFYTHPTRPVTMQLPATTTLQATFRDVNNRPVTHTGVHLGQLREDESYWLALPPALLNRFRGSTDAMGRLTLHALPQGWLAQLVLDDEHSPPSPSGVEHRTGGRFAPIAAEDAVALDVPLKQCVIRLLPPTTLKGRVSFGGAGKPVTDTRVAIRRIQASVDTDILRAYTDAQGNYNFEGLRPGAYKLWVTPNQKRSNARTWLSSEVRLQLRAGATNLHNIRLAKSAVIEGRVVSAQTGQPIVGQYVGISDTGEFSHYAITGRDGTFLLYAAGGKQHVWLQGNAISPPKGFAFPAKSAFDLAVPSGSTYSLTLRLPKAPVISSVRPVSPITGQVVDEAGQPVAGAQVSVEGLGDLSRLRAAATGGVIERLTTDHQGRFRTTAQHAQRAVQLWATADDRATVRGTMALNGDEVVLHLQPGTHATFTGRVTDAESKPLNGIKVTLYRCYSNHGAQTAITQTNTEGRYSFTGQRPNMNYMVGPRGPGLSITQSLRASQPGQTVTLDFKALSTKSFVAGQLLDEKGLPASGYSIWATGADDSVETDGSGRFRVPRTVSGKIVVTASSPNLMNQFSVIAGRSDLVLRLSRTKNHATRFAIDPMRKQKLAALLGKPGPNLTTNGWINSSPLSSTTLQGKIVLLHFFWGKDKTDNSLSELDAIAAQFASRGVQVIGVYERPRLPISPPFDGTQFAARIRELGITYPVALDANAAVQPQGASQSYIVRGTTHWTYELASFVIINPKGRVVYVGNSLAEAMDFVGGLVKPTKS